MNTPEEKAWHALAAVNGIGSRGLWLVAKHLARFGKTASWLLDRADNITSILPARAANLVMADFSKLKAMLVDPGETIPVTVLHPLHPAFPERLRVLKEKISLPALLYVRGDTAILERPAAAIIGKRNAGARAIALAEALAAELTARRINITSGHAVGTDCAAHLGALRAGGSTSIILAEGILQFKAKPEIKNHITAENSIIISQFEPNAPWAAYMAMTRNRLVAALSNVVVVIISGPERDGGGRNSGTFNAALAALKMGIPVFVVAPHFYTAPPEGNRQLLTRGGRSWNPDSGVEPIMTAMGAAAEEKHPGQRSLFE